jgi:hypothetical protein
MREMGTTNIRFISPVDGDMLHERDGVTTADGLQTTVKIAAPPDSLITVNGVGARYRDGVFAAGLSLTAYKNRIEARDGKTGEVISITVYRLANFAGGYRLSIDDNIWFLRDLHENTDRYDSIFDNPYLSFLREVHEAYGTRIHLNLFYQTDGFNLSQLSDKFRNEWKAQSGWLRLSFHALQEFPDMPYRTAGFEEVKKDCGLVMQEIRRFAGEELMGPVTTLHWGEGTAEGVRALREAGYQALVGYFNVDDDLPPVSYYLDVHQRRNIKKRFVWKDDREDMVFVRAGIVIDRKELHEIRPFLDAYGERGGKPPYVDLLVHEQYFYPFYKAYQPDFRERILAAVKWAKDNGYTPSFLSEAVFETRN